MIGTPFQPGNKLAKGGRREGAGRKSKDHDDVMSKAEVIAVKYIAEHVNPVLENYFKLAKGWEETRFSANGDEYTQFCYDGATTRHFVDKVLRDKDDDGENKGITQINFVQYNNTVQLHPEGVSTPVFTGNGSGHQAGLPSVAPSKRQGQDGIEFYDFSDVSRE